MVLSPLRYPIPISKYSQTVKDSRVARKNSQQVWLVHVPTLHTKIWPELLASQATAKGLKPKIPFFVTQIWKIRATLERDGIVDIFWKAGVTVAIQRMWSMYYNGIDKINKKSQETNLFSLLSTGNLRVRNDGNRNTVNFLTSPGVSNCCVAYSVMLHNPLTDSLKNRKMVKLLSSNHPTGEDLPSASFLKGRENSFILSKILNSNEQAHWCFLNLDRLQLLEPFDKWMAKS